MPATDEQAEKAVLGALLIRSEPRYVHQVRNQGLEPEHFYRDCHRDMYAAAVSLATRSEPVDPITLFAEMERLGTSEGITAHQVEELAAHVPSARHLKSYADRVRNRAEWRDRWLRVLALRDAVNALSEEAWERAVATVSPPQIAMLPPVPKPAPEPEPQPVLRLVVDRATGEVVEPAVTCEECQKLRDQLDGAHKDIKAWRARHAALKRASEEEAEQSPVWPQAVALFGVWKDLTGHPRSEWTLDRFWLMEPFIKKYGLKRCEQAIAGLAYDPYSKPMRNGRIKRYDDLTVAFKNADRFEEFCNRAPKDWAPTITIETRGPRPVAVPQPEQAMQRRDAR